MNQPLLTLERALSLVWPEQTRDFRIVTAHENPNGRDVELYRPYFYRRSKGVGQTDLQESACKMVIAQLIPWALTPKNMDDFMRVTEVCSLFLKVRWKLSCR